MRKEKIILSFTAALVGIAVAILAFYFYESSRAIKPNQLQKITIVNLSPTPQSSIFLTLDTPSDEDVVSNRILPISGHTVAGAKIVILTLTNEEAAVAASDGSYSTQITLDIGENIVEVDAVGPNGETAKVKKTVTYSTEDF